MAHKKTCTRCGDEFKLSKEDEELLDEGYISEADIKECDRCLNNDSQEDHPTFSDADPGL